MDTLFILGPNNWEYIAEQARQLGSDAALVEEIAKKIPQEVQPEVISMYPDFNRGKIDTDES